MEYALEGHGYCRSRALRDLPSWKDLPLERRVHLDAHLEQLALQGSAGGWARHVEAPPDLLDALHVRAPSSPRAALALDVATSVKEVFDALARTRELRITHCTIEEGAAAPMGETPKPPARPEAAHLVLGAWSPTIAAEVACGDEVAAGVVIALHGDVGGGGARVEVLSRIFRKVCENGAVVHVSDEPALEIAPHLLGAHRGRLRDEIERRVAASLDPVMFAADVESFRAGAVEALDHRGGLAGALLARKLPPGRRDAVMRRFEADTWTRWGLANAVTAEARWSPTFAEALLLERLGGSVARWHSQPDAERASALVGPAGAAASIEEPAPSPLTEGEAALGKVSVG